MEPKLPSISETKATRQVTDDDNEDSQLEPSPLWDREEEGWQMTWPIWHMLPRDERKELAFQHGYKTIGEFEEYMSLQQAFDDSEIQLQRPYKNEAIYPKNIKDEKQADSKAAMDKTVGEEQEDDDDDEASVDGDGKTEYDRQGSSCTEDLSPEELLELGGMILMLHDEILHQVFAWLPVDTYATLALVSPHWKHLTRTESVYRRLCERLYLNQSKRRQLHVSRFGGSYRNMLEIRPRVRAAGGCYVLKYANVKKIQRDMWTEIPVGAILETVYYRYLYFQEDGRVLYALTSAPPHDMFRRMLKVCIKKAKDVATVWGTFEVQKNNLTITARQEWHTVRFELTIESSSPIHGRFGSLVLNRHMTSVSNCFDEWSNDRVEYDVPDEVFRFVKDPRL